MSVPVVGKGKAFEEIKMILFIIPCILRAERSRMTRQTPPQVEAVDT